MLSIQDEAYKLCQEFSRNPICGFNHKDATIQFSFQAEISPTLQYSSWNTSQETDYFHNPDRNW